jgi:DNA-binding response OmpR family regulator
MDLLAKTILIIDDDFFVCQTVKDVLAKAGYVVIPAFDGYSGTQAAVTRKPDLILLDLNMPAGSGEQVYQRLKAQRETASIPIIFMSSMPSDQIKASFPIVGQLRVLSKPVGADRILSEVKSALAK